MASSDGKTRKGDTIAYTAEVSNEGNTCLTDVDVAEVVLSGGLDCGTGMMRESVFQKPYAVEVRGQ